MKRKGLLFLSLVLVFLLTMSSFAFADVSYHDFGALPDDPTYIPDGLEMNWDVRHNYDDIQDLLTKLEDEYPDITKLLFHRCFLSGTGSLVPRNNQRKYQ